MLSALTVSSCSQNDLLEDPAEWSTPLGFSSYIGTTTKASELVDSAFEEFTVEAYSTDNGLASSPTEFEKYIPALAVSRDYDGSDASWGYSGAYYWPSTNLLSFFAYATEGKADEATVTFASASSVLENQVYTITPPTLTYTADATIANQVDLIAASAIDKQDSGNSGEINLTFKHILTQINFAVTGAEKSAGAEEYSYIVRGIYINDAESKGVYTFDDANTTTDTNSSTATGVGSWTILPGNTATYNYFVPTADYYLTATDQTKETVTGTSGALMLIPQTVGDGPVIEVAYEVYQGSALVSSFTTTIAEAAAANAAADNTETTATTKTISLSGQVWKAGQNLVYNLTLPVGATKITFTTTELESWESASDYEADLADTGKITAPSTSSL